MEDMKMVNEKVGIGVTNGPDDDKSFILACKDIEYNKKTMSDRWIFASLTKEDAVTLYKTLKSYLNL